jgi:F-type H+-transporting ATPase subunit gamma
LLAGRDDVKTTCYVVMSADRGLCGGYNAGVQRAAEGEVKADVLAGKDYTIIPVGKKAQGYFRFRGYQLGQAFLGFTDQPSYDDARRIGEHVVELFTSGEVDKVELVYTRFITAGNQEVVLRPLVPLGSEAVAGGDGKDELGADFDFEPDPTTILDTLLPRYVEARIYAALLNAAASEHAFRQRAMKSATDNATELIKNLSIVMNRARQASITAEIMEIVGGAAALEGDELEAGYIDLGDDATDAVGTTPVDPISVAGTATIAGDEATEEQVEGGGVTTLERDELTRVEGLGRQEALTLGREGVTTFKELATLTPDQVGRMSELIGSADRIQRENWQGQARRLHNAKYPDDQI